MHMRFSELKTMPTRDRKYYIHKHNREVEEENERYKKRERGGKSTDVIDRYTDMEQENLKNASKR